MSAEWVVAIGLLVLPLPVLVWLVFSWMRHPFSQDGRGLTAPIQSAVSFAQEMVSTRRTVTEARTSVVAQVGVIPHASVDAVGYLVARFAGVDGAQVMPAHVSADTQTHSASVGAPYELSLRFQTEPPVSYEGARVRPLEQQPDKLELNIRVEGAGLQVSDGGNSHTLVESPSSSLHTFRVEPTREGPTRVRVDVYDRNAWRQTIDFELSVTAASPRSSAIGPIAAEAVRIEASNTLQLPAGALEARHLHLSLTNNHGEGGTYAVRANDGREPLAWRVMRTPCREKDIDEINAGLRSALNELRVYYENYLSSPEDEATAGAYHEALTHLARRGNDAFNRLFPDAEDRDYVLHAVRRVPRANVEISSDAVFLPWDLLYLEYDEDHEVDVARFFGFTANITRRLTDVRQSFSRADDQHTPPQVSLVANRQLPQVIERELPYFRTLKDAGKIVLSEWTDGWSPEPGPGEARGMLARFFDFSRTEHDVVHFACHAVAEAYSRDSYLDISVDLRLTIEEMSIRRYVFGGAPLAILNACGTGVRDSSTTSDFVRAFLMSGCCGVVATECDIPDLFASVFVQELFDRVLAGGPIALAIFETRHHFWTQYRNPLGLLYSAYLPLEARLR